MMVMMKMIMLGLVILVCSYLGKIKADSFGKRYAELKKFKRALGIFKSKLEFTYEPIGEIFESISNLVYEGDENIFERFLETNDWNLAVDSESNFENEDKEVAKSLGKMLGKLDKEGQLNEIYLTDGFIDKQIESALEVKNKNEKLYQVLGRSIGIALAIILI